MSREHKINYVEFSIRDMAATKEFFASAFGWTYVDYGPNYVAFENAGLDGGFALQEGEPPRGALVILFATDLEDSRARVLAAGGTISVDIFEFPGGRRFQFVEPSGNELAVWSDTGV